MKMFELLSLQETLPKITSKPLNIRTAYKFAKLAGIFDKEFIFYQTEFQKIIAEYADTDENGQFKFIEGGAAIAIKPGKEEECQRKIVELKDIDIDAILPCFTLDELDGLDFTPVELMSLMPLITE